jgi:cytochrome c oxidase subunit 2
MESGGQVMSVSGKDTAYRITGMVGLVALLALVLWAGQRRQSAPHQLDHSAPTELERDAGGNALKEHDTSPLTPSGRFENDVRVVDYDAFQYGFEPDPLVVRAGERVRLMVKSRDVTHGAMIPEVDFSIEISADNRKAAEFIAPVKPGEYPVFCSVFCGPDHGNMKGRLLVLPPAGDREPQDE